MKKVSAENIRADRSANQRKFSSQVLVFLVLGIAIAVIIAINLATTASLRKTVDVLVFKEAVTQGNIITESNLSSRKMIAAEYLKEAEKVLSDGKKRRAIVLWEDRERIVGTYAAYYIKENTAIYWSSLTKETTKKNSYLYKMDGELLKLSVSADVFGDMVVPGDRVNIRCLYTETTYNLPTVEEYEAMQQLGLTNQTTEEKMSMLFSGVSILDMLNSDGESIFDYYYDFINLPTSQQKAQLEDETFKKKTAPSNIMLCVTAEEADMYMRLQNKAPQYMITLLPREGSNLILDALADLDISNGL